MPNAYIGLLIHLESFNYGPRMKKKNQGKLTVKKMLFWRKKEQGICSISLGLVVGAFSLELLCAKKEALINCCQRRAAAATSTEAHAEAVEDNVLRR